MADVDCEGTLKIPPHRKNASGAIRRVGVELEFANVSVKAASDIVQDIFGGTLDVESEHRVFIQNTDAGNFTVELDAQIVHEDEDTQEAPSTRGEAFISSDFKTLKVKSRETLGHAVSWVVPAEIVSPPLPWDTLDDFTAVIDRLRTAGAKGTEDAPIYSFGLHLNPEVASVDADWVLRHLQAYLILEDWLRDDIGIDPTRKIFPHIDTFEDDYKLFALSEDYAPDTQTLIRDYIRFNPTRNRGLDMLPLFAHLDERLVKDCLDDTSLIKPRPTFHYRLPNASLSDQNWSAVSEWNRWLLVEELAADQNLLKSRAADYRAWLSKPRMERWLDHIQSWLVA